MIDFNVLEIDHLAWVLTELRNFEPDLIEVVPVHFSFGRAVQVILTFEIDTDPFIVRVNWQGEDIED